MAIGFIEDGVPAPFIPTPDSIWQAGQDLGGFNSPKTLSSVNITATKPKQGFNILVIAAFAIVGYKLIKKKKFKRRF